MILRWGHSNAVTINISQQRPSVLARLTLEDAQLKGSEAGGQTTVKQKCQRA